MRYYRVKPEFDNFRLWRNGKYAGILVANQLYTEKELEKRRVLFCRRVRFDMFERVEVPKNKVYWFFGARFADVDGLRYSDFMEV